MPPEMREGLFSFAEQRAEETEGESPRGFFADAARLSEDPALCESARRVAAETPGVDSADVLAAAVSAYCGVVSASFPSLHRAYADSTARRLDRPLAFRMKAIGVRLTSDRRLDQVSRPMARFALESIRTLECNPNVFAASAGASDDRVVRPFGWSPADDPDVFLSLLLVRQARGRYRPNAFVYSPLAFFLRSEALADVARVERFRCADCGKECFGRNAGTPCPECRGEIRTEVSEFLLSARRLEEPMADVVASDEEPVLHVEREETRDRAWDIATSRARDLWHGILGVQQPRACKTAVLLVLCGLHAPPLDDAIRNPRKEWLRHFVQAFLTNAASASGTASQAAEVLAHLPVVSPDEPETLRTDNFRTIVSRFRHYLLG
jgi:hypothetical protein